MSNSLEKKKRALTLATAGLLSLTAGTILAQDADCKSEKKSKTSISVESDYTAAIDKDQHKEEVKSADTLAEEQAKVINKIPGSRVKAKDLKQAPMEKGPGLNPIGWLFSPVTKLQKQSVILQQEIMKLTGPIAALQPSMIGLNNRMTDVKGEMGRVRNSMNTVEGSIGGVKGSLSNVQSQMQSVQNELRRMQQDIHSMQTEMLHLRQPIEDLRGPIVSLKKPLSTLEKPISTIGSRMDSLDSQMNDLKTMLGMVLSSIYVAAALIAFGTPFAAIMIWRHRARLLSNNVAQHQNSTSVNNSPVASSSRR